jgi:hypothetical protein
MLLLGGNSVGVAHARKTHRGKYGEATPWRQRGGGGSPPPYPLRKGPRERSQETELRIEAGGVRKAGTRAALGATG